MYFYEEIDGPTNVVTNQVTEDTASVSWDPVRAVIDKYVVRYISPDGESKEKAVPKDKSSTVLTGLKPGEAYKVFVWAERGNQGSKKADTKALTGNGRMGLEKLLQGKEEIDFEGGDGCHLASTLLLVGLRIFTKAI